MNRAQKAAVIASLQQSMAGASATFLLKYKGTTVAGLQELRRAMKKQDSSFKVAKGRLMKLAAHGVEGADAFAESFKDQVGLVFVRGDVFAAAKSLVTFSAKNGTVSLIAGLFEKSVLSADEVKVLAMIPSREVLLAQVLGTLQAPVAQFVRLLNCIAEQKAS